MDTEALRTFIKLSRIGNLTRAAEVLGKSQPSLSRLVSGIEAEVGQRLLFRGRAGLKPTEAGHSFLDGAVNLLTEFDGLIDQVRLESESLVGAIKVGIPHSFTTAIGLRLANCLLSEAPKADVELKFGLSHEIEQALAFGQLDLGILIGIQTDAHLLVEPCAPDPVMFMASRGSRFEELARGPVEWKQLDGVPLALPPTDNQLRRRIEAGAGKAGINLRPVIEVGSANLTIELVSQGDLCTLLPNSLQHRLRASGHVVSSPVDQDLVVWSVAKSRYAEKSHLLDQTYSTLIQLLNDVVRSKN